MPMGGLEIFIVLIIILLFFGARRIPELARSFGIGARELKKAASEDEDENQAKEPDKTEAREHGEQTKPIQQEDGGPEEQDVRAEPDSKAQRSGA
jgi:sec-independent protein translocase protein TatA